MSDFYGIFEDFIMEDFSEPDDDDADKYWEQGIYEDESNGDTSKEYIETDDDDDGN